MFQKINKFDKKKFLESLNIFEKFEHFGHFSGHSENLTL